MQWVIDLFSNHHSPAYIIIIYAIVISAGVMLGKLSFKGVSLGVAFVLFSGILVSYLGFEIDHEVLDFIKEFGLILFVYTMGLQVGPGFFASLQKQGLRLNGLASLCVLFSVGVVVSIFYFTKIPMASLVGLMSGAVTNTPGLGAAQQTVKDLSDLHPYLKTLTPLGTHYAIAYPMGVLGIILVMILGKAFLKAGKKSLAQSGTEKEETAPRPGTLNLQVKNPSLIGQKVQTLFDTLNTRFVVSRIFHNNEVHTATKETILTEGDVILVVAQPKDFDKLRTLVGPASDMDLSNAGGNLVAKKIYITKQQACGKPLADLDIIQRYHVTITRVLRSGIEFIPSGQNRLQFGDIVTAIGDEYHVDELAKEFGNSTKKLREPNIAGLFIGIVLGVLVGNIPWAFPGIHVPVKLGLAGGPLIVALLISRYGSLLPMTSYVSQSANYFVREIGIVLFLSSVGLGAGAAFIKTIASPEGVQLLFLGSCITLIPLILTTLIARFAYKMNILQIFGLLAGASTDPPALSFATKSAESDLPAVSYATVYPLTMFLRIMVAQLLILLFV